MRVPGEHGLDPVSSDLGQVGVVNASGSKVRDVAVAALVGADVQAGGLLGGLPKVAVEGALAPEAAAGRWEEELAVGTVEVDLGFEHPGEGCRHRDDAAGVGLAVVGLGALEDPALVGGAADLERLAVESSRRSGSTFPSLSPQSVNTRTIAS